jgi:hypothetical protein
MGQLSLNAKLFYRSAGTYNAPTFTEVSLIADGNVNFVWDEGGADDRSDPAHRMMKTQFALEFTGNMKKLPLNAAYEFMYDLGLSRAVADILLLDGPVNQVGARGFRFDGQLFSLSEDQSLANVLYNALTIKPTDSPDGNRVKAARVGAGPALTYGTIGGDVVPVLFA